MNILMVGELYKFGGASEIMEILSDGLKRKGHKVTLLYGYNYGKYDIEEDHYVLFNNVLIRKINARMRYWIEKENFINLYTRLYIKKLIKDKKIDIIHFHAMQGGFLYLTDIEDICKKQKVIWTIHDTWPFTGGCMYYWNCKKWENMLCNECEELELQVKYKNTKINYERKRKILQGKNICYVAPSVWMLTNINKSFLANEKKTLINNGIDLQMFRPLDNIEELKQKYGINNRKKILMFSAGSVTNKYKGWRYLKEALFQLKYVDEYALIIVGKDSGDLGELNIEMINTGFMRNKSVLNELYNIADIFIIPSVQDNFPTVTLEAQASGTPVLAFALGGIKEQVTNETGWLVNEINSNKLAESIENVFSSKDWRKDISIKGRNARNRCEELFDEKKMVDKYEEVYGKRQCVK